jgi:hypothetical protein
VLEAGQAPRVVLRATHEGALDYCALADLKRLAVDLSLTQTPVVHGTRREGKIWIPSSPAAIGTLVGRPVDGRRATPEAPAGSPWGMLKNLNQPSLTASPKSNSDASYLSACTSQMGG